MTQEKSCYLIGAIDLNHNGEEELAKRLIDLAVETGLNAVKFQKRTVDKVWTQAAREKPFPSLPEYGRTLGEVYQALELHSVQLKTLRSYCHGKIDFWLAPFDLDSLQLAMELEVDGVKIDPPYITNVPFLKAVAKTLGSSPKRICVSVSACTHEDIEQVVDIFKGSDLILLHTVYARSLPIEGTFLGWVRELVRYGVPIGYSDHGPDPIPALVAFSLGARVIEKPFTLYHHLRGLYHSHSMDMEQLRRFVRDMRALEVALEAKGERRLLPSEVVALDEERIGLFAARDIRAGEAISSEMLTVKSPSRGLTPSLIDFVVGRKAVYDIKAEEPITFGLIE